MTDSEWGSDWDDNPLHDSSVREPMHDMDAEKYLLGAMMNHPAAIEAAAQHLMPEHFYRPAHQVIYRAMVLMHVADERPDPVTLRDRLEVDGDAKALGDSAALYLAELYAVPALAGASVHYAEIILACAVRRTLREAGVKLISMSDDRGVSPGHAADKAIALIVRAMSAKVETRAPTLTEFLGQEFAGGEWVIPNFLARQDRVVVVGPEGAGKTMLSHQIGYAAAAGIHPFTWATRIEPRRTLIMDFENPAGLLQRRMRKMEAIAERYPDWDSSRVMVHHAPGGTDMSNPQQMYALAQLVRKAEPDLIIAGPIYKMLGSADNDHMQQSHRRVAEFFDRMRERHGCAVWLEAHAPYGGVKGREMRPEGSNLWAKWPEFGIGLDWATKAHGGANGGLDLTQFRGHREEGRPWPSWVTRSSPGSWPWTANYDQDVFTPTLRYEGEGDA